MARAAGIMAVGFPLVAPNAGVSRAVRSCGCTLDGYSLITDSVTPSCWPRPRLTSWPVGVDALEFDSAR